MKQFRPISGFITVKLTGADIPSLLQRFAKEGILLFHIQRENDLIVYVWVRRSDYQKLKVIAGNHGADVAATGRSGIYWIFSSFIRRPILVAGISILLVLSWFVPTRVFFISVEGNDAVPTRLILEKAAECGITFGANRRDVRSEKMKNSLLGALPQLQWTGVNTYGCTAVISVTERSEPEETTQAHGISSIVADRDGVIYSCTVASGNPLCVEGQAVRAGEVLVSGYTDCGIKIQATRAKAEIFAQTLRQLTVKTPLDYKQKGDLYQTSLKFSLILGKKRINFSKDSGISPPTCDKMYSQYYCVLPGGFQLPIAVAVEQCYFRKTDTITAASQISQVCAEEFVQDYLVEQMLCGKILGKLEQAEVVDRVYTLKGSYVCLEMIGRERSEEIIKHYEQSD